MKKRATLWISSLIVMTFVSVGAAQAQTVDWGSVLTGAPKKSSNAAAQGSGSSKASVRHGQSAGAVRKSSQRSKGAKTAKKGKPVPLAKNWPWKESKNLDTLPISDTDKFGINKVRSVIDGKGGGGNLAGWLEKAAEEVSAGIAVGVIAVLVKTLGKFSMVIVGLMSVGVCQFFKSSTPMSSSSGPRGGLEHAGGLSIGAAVGAFIFGVALVLLIPVSGGASSNHQKANPKFVPVHSKDLKFHLYIPEPIIKEKHLESENGLTIPYDVVGWNNDDPLRRRELAMAYEVLPSAQDMAKAKGLTNSALNTLFPGQVYYYLDGEKGLDGVVDSLRKRSGITVDHVCSVGLQNKYPGREVEGTISDGSGRIARTRIFLIDNQIVIQLCVAGEPDWVNSNDAYKFFDSLAIDR